MKFRTLLAATAILTGMAGLAGAQSLEDIIKLRQALMNSNEAATKVIVSMLRQQIPYDAAVVAAALTTVSHDNAVFPNFFPVGTETGAETEALPAVWTDMAEFQELSTRMAADAQAAATLASEAGAAVGERGSPEQTAFLAAFKTVADNCTACHEKFRVEKD
jgi:cytochrome c556